MTRRTVEELSNYLYDMDPMGTCCNVNGMRDEYDKVAADLLKNPDVHDVFNYWWWDGCLKEKYAQRIRFFIQNV